MSVVSCRTPGASSGRMGVNVGHVKTAGSKVKYRASPRASVTAHVRSSLIVVAAMHRIARIYRPAVTGMVTCSPLPKL